VSLPIRNTYASDTLEFSSCISTLFQWFKKNRLIVNFNKCKIVNYHCGHNILKSIDLIKIDNIEYTFQLEYKYLGIIIDNKLKFSSQFLILHRKLNYYIKLFHHLSSFLSCKYLTKIYLAFILPVLEYCNSVYFLFNKKYYSKISKLNIKLLKFTHLDLSYFNIGHRLLYQACFILFKVHNHRLPSYLNIFIKPSYTSRSLYQFPQTIKSNCFKFSYLNWSIILCNLLYFNNILFSDKPTDFEKKLILFLAKYENLHNIIGF
jgi:hypothetical protein